jgi:hypothetical protein
VEHIVLVWDVDSHDPYRIDVDVERMVAAFGSDSGLWIFPDASLTVNRPSPTQETNPTTRS